MKRCASPLQPSCRVPAWWAPLHEASGSDSIFVSAEWMQTWLDAYGADFKGVWLHWEVDGAVVAGCLMVERTIRVKGIPFRTMFLNATGEAAEPTPLAEFNDVLHLPGHGSAVAASLAEFMRAGGCNRLLLSGHAQDGPAAAVAGLLCRDHVEHVAKPAPYVDIATLAGKPFVASLSGKIGMQVRRNLREYVQRLGELSVRRAADLPETLAYFEEMRELHLARWNSREQSTTLSAPVVVQFHRRLIESLFDSGQVDMLRVGSADQPIGFLYTFVVRGKVSMFQSGFAYEQESKWSPGMATLALAIEYYQARGLREYDFLAGDARYKRALSNGLRDIVWTTIYRDRAWIRLLLLGRQLRRQFAPERRVAEAT
jgi:CelD/BcsL family acetyltransferase involved in cellulose biosynthesis